MNPELISHRRRELQLKLYSHVRKLLFYGSLFCFATFGLGFFWFLVDTPFRFASVLLLPTLFIWLSSLEDIWKMSCRVQEDLFQLRSFNQSVAKPIRKV